MPSRCRFHVVPLLCALVALWSAAPLRVEVIIAELLADNVTGLADEDGTHQDWIELYNTGAAAVSLNGWWLTDKLSNKTEWAIPDIAIAAGGTLFIWASGKDRRVPGQPLHANFSLAKSGEYLGLYQPHGVTGLPVLVSEISPSYAYDNLNIPATVNYLVTRQLNSDGDHGHKNFYLYRDTPRTGEWQPIIWDVDLSHGHNWNGSEGYFDDDLVSNNPLNAHSAADRVYDIILESPEMQAMWVRRMRTLMDTLLQAPGTTNGILESRMREIAAAVDPDPNPSSTWTDGDPDAALWGIDSRFLQNRPREEVERVITGYLAPRRAFLFDQGVSRPLLSHPTIANGIPLPNTPQAAGPGAVTVDALDFYPSPASQAGEYIILRNTTSAAIDLSGWTLAGAVKHTFQGGTVIPVGAGSAAFEYKGLLHVVKDAAAFRARTAGPRGGEYRFIQGNYDGQLSARGETIDIRDASGALISSFTYAGSPTTLQQSLRISEIQYHPLDPTAAETAALPGVTAEDFEYLELLNIGNNTINLTGVTFSQGLTYTFGSGIHLTPGGRLVLARNPAAFAVRHSGVTGQVLGPYIGKLDNSSERLELTDPSGESILDFQYKDGWYPATDGSGRSLVLRDAAIAADDFGNATSWAISGNPLGSPGTADSSFGQAYHGYDNFHFSEAERDTPSVSDPAADPDGDGRPNFLEYALATDPRANDPCVQSFIWSMQGMSRHAALRFNRPCGALDLTYDLPAANMPAGPWQTIPSEIAETTRTGATTESVVLRDAAASSSLKRFYRLRFSLVL